MVSISKEQQIIALLTGTAWELLQEQGNKNVSYADIFTITRAEVHQYVAKHGLPRNLNVNNGEGLCYYVDNGTYTIYYNERGTDTPIGTYTNQQETITVLIETLIDLSGMPIN